MATQNDLLLKAYEKLGGSAEDLVTTPELQFMPTTTALIYLIALKIAGGSTVVTLDAGTTSYLVPDGTIIDFIDVYEPLEIEFSAGFAANDTDFIDVTALPVGGGIFNRQQRFVVGTTIYFNGCTPDTVISIGVRKFDNTKYIA